MRGKIICFVIICALFLAFFAVCTERNSESLVNTENANVNLPADQQNDGDTSVDYSDIVSSDGELSEFQTEACNAAQEAGTCDTKLAELGIVSKDECCVSLSICC